MPPPRRVSRAGAVAQAVGGAIVRRHDRDRYQTALFAPADRREALFALYAFNYEVARVRESRDDSRCSARSGCNGGARSSRRPMPGAPARRHEVVEPLVAAIARIRAVARRISTGSSTRASAISPMTPPADLAALIDYAEGTSSTLLFLDAGGARGRRAGNGRGGARGRDRLCAGRAVAGDAVSCRFRALRTSRRISRRGPGSIRRPMRGVRDTPALRDAAAELAEAAAAHLAAARRSAGRDSAAGAARPCCRR